MEQSAFSKEITKIIPILGASGASVLLTGEKGTGKRFIAIRIYEVFSEKSSKQSDFLSGFFEINFKCSGKQGCFEKIIQNAQSFLKTGQEKFKKVLFLNCIEKCPYEMQEKLFLMLKDYFVCNQNVKVISSSEISLEEACRKNDFIPDFYNCLNSVIINVLPLRQRKEDILSFARDFRIQYNAQTGLEFEGFTDEAINRLTGYFYSGNIDELKNIIQHGFITGTPPLLKAADLFCVCGDSVLSEAADSAFTADKNKTDKSLKTALDAFKREYITKILEENGWNQTKTAKILGIQRTYVIRLINELQIRRK